MVTGSGQANVAITGTFTIPLMKKIGYPAAMAGGIESAASTGGSIMPPVMGIVAFVMAQYTGTPYFELIKMAVIPALLYYGCIAIFVHFQAKKLGIMVKETERVNWKRALSAAPLFIVPVIVLVYLLAIGKSLRYTVFYVVITLFLIGLLRKESRATVFDWLHGLKKGVIIGAEIGATMGLVGAMVACMDLTGLLVKFPGIITGLANGNLFIMLILTAVVTIILGCGLPPFACYLLVAMMAASALIKAGLVMMQAHFFIYLFATFALITPPVGLCNVVAAPIAQESYMKVSWQAVRAGCVAWILPVMVIGAPAIILIPLSPLIDWLPRLISCFFLIVMLQVTVVGYFIADTPIWQRLIMGTGAAAIVCYVARGGVLFGLAGLAAFLLVLIWQLAKRARLKNDGRTAQAA
jgi:TRAP transporter 4TM/12TM fusion protein